ncbi:MAG TPA: protein kinase [Kofleriaceae bacterium]|nr:protein kinase [Kofleriaceae bacterium]
MSSIDGTDPALAHTPVPLDGDGSELIGVVIDGRYRLDATLGRGGMGLVYRATHVGLRRQVAVKILHPSLAASPEVRNRFEREALAVGRVDHPNCVATYDVGRLPDGSLYLAMELLEGKSLADVLEAEGQIAPGRALHILAHMLRGLGSIHQAGLIHRDIKPENIFLVRQGEDMDFAKILDFGIAKPISGELSDDGVRLTQAGMAFGTPIYMAPEQALGNPMDGRADLYAAAVVAYEMLCGQPPFYSEDKLEVMSMHTAKPVPPMRSKLIKGGKPVPSSIEKLIVRGLTKKPGDRYANAEVFLAAVEQALHTPEGGQTDLEFERVDTGSQPLVGDFDEDRLDINSAIEEAITLAPSGQRVATPSKGARLATPAKGAESRVGTKLGVGVETAPAPPVLASGDARGRVGGGGVGIGIPFTGPAGEPIFGLTPEQRLAQVPPKRRWWLYVLIAVLATGVGVGIAIWTKPADDNKLDPNSPAGQASEALERGDPAKAIAILEKAPIDKDADAQLVLGEAYAARNENLEAIEAYRRALALAPDVESDKKLRASLRAMAADKDPDVVAKAFDLWVGRTKDPEAAPSIDNAAVSQQYERRHAVAPIIEKYKLGDGVEWLKAYTLDLEEGETCEIRKEAVAKLRALADPRAIEPLERAIAKKIKSGPLRGKPVSACLIDDANAAIGYLRGLKK